MTPRSLLPSTDAAIKQSAARRQRIGAIWRALFLACIAIGLIALALLLARIVNDQVGLVAVTQQRAAASLADRPLDQLPADQLAAILQAKLTKNVYNRLEREQPLAQRSPAALLALIDERVLERRVVASWPLSDSLLRRSAIAQELAQSQPRATLEWRWWLSSRFLSESMHSKPEFAGVRTALLGSLWVVLLTILIAFPIGVGAAIYLEEYARDTRLNRLIRTNIYNLAGVPSIIYGMLGLAIFVRALAPYTSGAALGVSDSNGRTILSAALTMALLVLPLIIINAQEAIRAVPGALRMASYGLGATQWQTIWHQVLPQALPGVLTGTILALARALGETAPLIVVGASTFIVFDPRSPFAKFTTLPIQIYDWTARPEQTFHNAAAAAIGVLLVLLLTLNAAAIWLRNRARA